jgi:hypothetical protein
MSGLSKQALLVENNQSFPNNNAGLISATNLRTFNENMIDSTVNQAVYTADSASFDARIDAGGGGGVPAGTISGSSQVDYPLISNIPSGIISSSQQLPAGLVSGSSQLTSSYDIRYQLSGSDAPLPSGVVSGSSQVSYIGLSNIPSGIISSSQQLPAGLVSGSSQVSSITGSSLVTASFASQTLTFTKGDGTTFGVNIPDVSGSDITALNAFTSSQELLNGTFATTGSNTFIGNQDITGDILTNGNTNLFANNNDTSPLLVETQNGAKLKVYTKNEEDASEIAVEFYGNTFTDGYVSAQSLQAEPGDADTFPLEVTDGIAPRIIVNSQNEASSSGRNIDITGNTRIISTATNKIGAISISYANPSGANAALSIGADNFNTAKSKVDFNASEMKFGTDGGVSSRVAFGDPSSTDQIDFSTSGSSQMLKLESSGYLIVSGNINMAPNTAIVGGLFESTGEMATPLLLVDTIEPNTDTKVSITAVINLGAQDPLPAGAIGDLSVSGSALYFYDGAWKTVSLV